MTKTVILNERETEDLRNELDDIFGQGNEIQRHYNWLKAIAIVASKYIPGLAEFTGVASIYDGELFDPIKDAATEGKTQLSSALDLLGEEGYHEIKVVFGYETTEVFGHDVAKFEFPTSTSVIAARYKDGQWIEIM